VSSELGKWKVFHADLEPDRRWVWMQKGRGGYVDGVGKGGEDMGDAM